MAWVVFVAGAVLSWGAYGAFLGLGTAQLQNPLKALLCVGVAYFLIGVIIPVVGLSAQRSLSAFNSNGLVTATIAGALGAAGAALTASPAVAAGKVVIGSGDGRVYAFG